MRFFYYTFDYSAASIFTIFFVCSEGDIQPNALIYSSRSLGRRTALAQELPKQASDFRPLKMQGQPCTLPEHPRLSLPPLAVCSALPRTAALGAVPS